MFESRVALLAKKSVAASQRSSTGWMPESIGRLSIGVERRHPVTMRKASYSLQYNASVSAATLDWCAVLSY